MLDPLPDAASPPDAPPVPASAEVVLAVTSGFVVRVDEGALLAAAVQANAVLIITAYPGNSLVAGPPLGHTWCPAGADGAAVAGRVHG